MPVSSFTCFVRILILCKILPSHVVLGCSILMVEWYFSIIFLESSVIFFIFCLEIRIFL